jgi:hypothetical protein
VAGVKPGSVQLLWAGGIELCSANSHHIPRSVQLLGFHKERAYYVSHSPLLMSFTWVAGEFQGSCTP